MKKLLLAIAAIGTTMCSFAQTDTSGKEKVDTIRVGGMIIIKKKGKNPESGNQELEVVAEGSGKKSKSRVSTNWMILDLGLSNLNDETNYASAAAQTFAPGLTKDDMKLRTSKSINVNIWLFMQRLRLDRSGIFNLKYGLGAELNNYRFQNKQIELVNNPSSMGGVQALENPTWNNLVKNKLAADYLTVPLMLNVNFAPRAKKSYGFSAGVSVGYLYSARQKIKDNDGNKTKYYSDFDLNKWKFSYIGELNLGPVKLYGSYALKSMWSGGLDQTPFNFGIRLSNW